jgi:Regulator of ribonuclease activity B
LNLQTSPIEWLPLLLLGASALVMVFLLRRAMRGMNQQDWILLRKARSRGIDVRQPQAVDFVVFAATEQTATELADKMRGDSFETSIKQAQIQYARNRNKPSAPQDGWLVSGRRTVLLVPETLIGIRKTLTEMSLERKAVYLGWQLSDAPASQGSSIQR